MAREAPQAITIPTMSCTINVIADGSIYALAGIEKNTIPRQKNKENINALPIFFIFPFFSTTVIYINSLGTLWAAFPLAPNYQNFPRRL